MRSNDSRVAGAGLAFLLTILAVMTPAAVTAHASLVSSEPRDGEVLYPGPTEIVARFDEELDPERSRLVLRDRSGATLAEGGVPADDPTSTTMRLRPPALDDERYEVRWVAVTPDDGAVERGTFSFLIMTFSTDPDLTFVPEPSASASGTAASTPGGSSAAGATAASTPTPGPTPAPSTTPSDGIGGGDALLPLVVLAALVAAAAVFLLRRRRLPSGP